jgi:hypothetical protein
MAGFVQIIEYRTSRIDEVEKLNDEWRDRFPEMGPSRVLVCRDRDQENTYLAMVEFDSYEAAMRNSEDPATTEYAQRMQALCDGPAIFRNLDVIRQELRMEARQQTGTSSMTDA